MNLKKEVLKNANPLLWNISYGVQENKKEYFGILSSLGKKAGN